MTAIDRAFIKAFSRDEAEPSPPPPHLDVVAAAREPIPAEDRERARPALEREFQSVRVEQASGKPAAVANPLFTRFVPPPHFELTPHVQTRQSKRTPLGPFGHRPPPTTDDSTPPNATPIMPAAPVEANGLFEPALGVPAFEWPEICQQLQARAPQEFRHLAERLVAAAPAARRVIALCGLHRQQGATTTLLCAARQLAELGVRTAIVDADFSRPSLAERLGLAVEAGWETMLAGRRPLAEAMIYSEGDRLALLPLVPHRHGELQRLAGSPLVAQSFAELRRHYDVVLVDAGPMLDEPATTAALLIRGAIGASLIVRDARGLAHEAEEAAAQFTAVGAPLIGICENFVAPGGAAYRPPHETKQSDNLQPEKMQPADSTRTENFAAA